MELSLRWSKCSALLGILLSRRFAVCQFAELNEMWGLRFKSWLLFVDVRYPFALVFAKFSV